MSTTTDQSTTTTIDAATHDDIVAAAHVYQAAAESLSDLLRARNPWTNSAARAEDLQQAIRTLSTLRGDDRCSVIVARLNDEIVGVAAVQIQSPHAHIAFLFVHPEAQNKGVGRRLLDRLGETIAEAGATVITLASSRDPRAWQRYLRFGLYPGPPQLPFRATKPVFPVALPLDSRRSIRQATAEDIEILAALDRDVRGAERRDRIRQWLAEGSIGSIVFDRGTGNPVGYAMVSMLEHNGQIGPVVAASAEHFRFLLDVALFTAGTLPNPDNRPWRIDFSARNHLAIAPLLEAGFTAENLVNWFESGPPGQWDRYIFRDEDEL